MKIALITDDGKSISQHFGRAPYYLVVTLEDGKEVNRELRPKQGHNQFLQAGEHAEHSAGQEHGRDNDSHEKHISMTDTIQDCAALICGGMGYGAYESMPPEYPTGGDRPARYRRGNPGIRRRSAYRSYRETALNSSRALPGRPAWFHSGDVSRTQGKPNARNA